MQDGRSLKRSKKTCSLPSNEGGTRLIFAYRKVSYIDHCWSVFGVDMLQQRAHHRQSLMWMNSCVCEGCRHGTFESFILSETDFCNFAANLIFQMKKLAPT